MHVLIQPSRWSRIVYELRPGLDQRFRGRRVTTSSAGFRDREYSRDKPPGVRRIIGLGDSVMFGWGVADGEDYMALLEERLSRERRARFEVINTAVPGYNGVMEVETLLRKGLAYRPDLVVLGFCGNDLELPGFLIGREDYLSLDRSWLFEFVSRRLRGPAADPGPPHYAGMVGLDAYERALSTLRDVARREGFEVLVLHYPAPLEFMRRAARRLGFAQLSLAPAVQRFHSRHGGREAGRRLLRLSEADRHPTPIGHRLIADGLYDHLARSGRLDRLEGLDGAN
jgi:lysophospholipase L1-like esterase